LLSKPADSFLAFGRLQVSLDFPKIFVRAIEIEKPPRAE
jgi:hypothetical protein